MNYGRFQSAPHSKTYRGDLIAVAYRAWKKTIEKRKDTLGI